MHCLINLNIDCYRKHGYNIVKTIYREVIYMTISERIFKVMEEQGMTQLEFSRLTGIAQSTISDWRRKGTNPAADKLLIISNVLNISVYELLQDQDSMNPEKDPVDLVIVSKDSESYQLLAGFNRLDRRAKDRLLGYLSALSNK